MHVAFTVLRADGTEHDGRISVPDERSDPHRRKCWKAVRAAVCDVIGEDADPEHVRVWHNGRYHDMFVDEIGIEKGLPENAKATAIYRANALAHEVPKPHPDELPIVAGDVVLFHETVWG